MHAFHLTVVLRAISTERVPETDNGAQEIQADKAAKKRSFLNEKSARGHLSGRSSIFSGNSDVGFMICKESDYHTNE